MKDFFDEVDETMFELVKEIDKLKSEKTMLMFIVVGLMGYIIFHGL